MDNNTKQVIEELSNNFGTLIEKAALKLGTTAEHLWEVLVKQQIISAYVQIFVSTIVGVALGFIWFKIIKRLRTADREETLYGGFLFPVTVFTSFFSLFFVIFTLSQFSSLVGKLINPEYAALKEVMKMVRG
jgi:hypothetical protein